MPNVGSLTGEEQGEAIIWGKAGLKLGYCDVRQRSYSLTQGGGSIGDVDDRGSLIWETWIVGSSCGRGWIPGGK